MPKVTEAQIAAAEAAAASARAERERVTKELAAARTMVEAARKAANDAEANSKRIAAEVKQQGIRSHNKTTTATTTIPSSSSSSSTSSSEGSTTVTKAPSESEFISQVLDNNLNIGFEHNPFEVRPPIILNYTVALTLPLLNNNSESPIASRNNSNPVYTLEPSTKLSVHLHITSKSSTKESKKASPNTLAVYLPGDNDYIGIYAPGTDYTFENIQCNHKNIEYVDSVILPYKQKYNWKDEDIIEDLSIEGTVTIKLPGILGNYEVWYINENGIFVNKLTDILVVHKKNSISSNGSSRNNSSSSNTGNGSILSSSASLSESPSSSILRSDVPILTSLPSSSSNSNNQRTYRPPYILEKQVRISTYQLYIPLPNGIRTSTMETRVGGSSTTIAKNDTTKNNRSNPSDTAAVSPSYLSLPVDWNPGVAIDGDNALNAKTQPSIEVQFELPQIPVNLASINAKPEQLNNDQDNYVDEYSTPYSAYDASLSMLKNLASYSSDILTNIPRDLYRIKIFLSQRIERSKCTVRLGGDHILIRLPMYYTGAAITDRPQSLISIEETLSLRRQGRQLACRECGNILIRPSAATNDDNTMKAYVLPSEYWLEWVDFWMCHETSSNIFIPDVDFGAIRSTILMGETHLQIHPGDIRPQAITIRPDSHEFLHQRKLLAESLQHEYQLPGDTIVVGFEHAVRCTLECTRCMNTLGTSRFVLPSLTKRLSVSLTMDSPEVHESYTLLPLHAVANDEENESTASAVSPTYVFSHDKWNDKLSPDIHPVLRFNKDRLSVPVDTEKEPLNVSKTDRVTMYLKLNARERNAFYHYGISSRVASDLLSIMYARSQYKYIIVNKDSLSKNENKENSSDDDTNDDNDTDGKQLRIFQNTKILLTIMNWNGSVKGNTNYRSWLPTDSMDIMKKEYKDTTLPKARLGRWEDNRGLVYSDGIPVLQVRYRILDDSYLNPEDIMDILQWDHGKIEPPPKHAHDDTHEHHHHHQHPGNSNSIRSHLLFLGEDECETIISALMASSTLLPASVRTINSNNNNSSNSGDPPNDEKEFVGYLPFWDV